MRREIRCVDCNEAYGPFFLWVDDATWKKLGYKKKDFACAHCIINRFTERGIWYAYLISGEGTHTIDSASAEITMTQKHRRVIAKPIPLPLPKHNLEIGKEYEVQQRFATLAAIEGSTAVCVDRWENRFEVDIGEVREKGWNKE